MSQSTDFTRFFRSIATIVLTTFVGQSIAGEALIVINRVATDQYAVISVKDASPEVNYKGLVLKTKYCHEYASNQQAYIVSREDGGENALLFLSGAQCEIVGATKANDSKFNLLDFLIQIGIAAATKGLIVPGGKK
jgi:hypothetical protein